MLAFALAGAVFALTIAGFWFWAQYTAHREDAKERERAIGGAILALAEEKKTTEESTDAKP